MGWRDLKIRGDIQYFHVFPCISFVSLLAPTWSNLAKWPSPCFSLFTFFRSFVPWQFRSSGSLWFSPNRLQFPCTRKHSIHSNEARSRGGLQRPCGFRLRGRHEKRNAWDTHQDTHENHENHETRTSGLDFLSRKEETNIDFCWDKNGFFKSSKKQLLKRCWNMCGSWDVMRLPKTWWDLKIGGRVGRVGGVSFIPRFRTVPQHFLQILGQNLYLGARQRWRIWSRLSTESAGCETDALGDIETDASYYVLLDAPSIATGDA